MGNHVPVKAGDARDTGSSPGSGRFAGGGNGSPLQYSCQEDPMDRGAWQAIAMGLRRVRLDCGTEHTQLTKVEEKDSAPYSPAYWR